MAECSWSEKKKKEYADHCFSKNAKYEIVDPPKKKERKK